MITAQQFNQLSPAQQLAALKRATATQRTRKATVTRELQRMEAQQKRKEAMIASVLAYCPEFFDGTPLHAAV